MRNHPHLSPKRDPNSQCTNPLSSSGKPGSIGWTVVKQTQEGVSYYVEPVCGLSKECWHTTPDIFVHICIAVTNRISDL